ncbi:hypothetical protein KSS87_008161 [Heliosperma pusillum]|nr:hypothetical protein KSS87_008161 [Heliosperma pusillum]
MFHFLTNFVPRVLGCNSSYHFLKIFVPRVLSRGRSYLVRLNHQITRTYPFSR